MFRSIGTKKETVFARVRRGETKGGEAVGGAFLALA
jgi:hypothetical protein